MNTALYLQIISILMAVIAVALPALIAIVGFVYVRRMTERIGNIAAEVNELWDCVKKDQPWAVLNQCRAQLVCINEPFRSGVAIDLLWRD